MGDQDGHVGVLEYMLGDAAEDALAHAAAAVAAHDQQIGPELLRPREQRRPHFASRVHRMDLADQPVPAQIFGQRGAALHPCARRGGGQDVYSVGIEQERQRAAHCPGRLGGAVPGDRDFAGASLDPLLRDQQDRPGGIEQRGGEMLFQLGRPIGAHAGQNQQIREPAMAGQQHVLGAGHFAPVGGHRVGPGGPVGQSRIGRGAGLVERLFGQPGALVPGRCGRPRHAIDHLRRDALEHTDRFDRIRPHEQPRDVRPKGPGDVVGGRKGDPVAS
jgi:hypothetical protein